MNARSCEQQLICAMYLSCIIVFIVYFNVEKILLMTPYLCLYSSWLPDQNVQVIQSDLFEINSLPYLVLCHYCSTFDIGLSKYGSFKPSNTYKKDGITQTFQLTFRRNRVDYGGK